MTFTPINRGKAAPAAGFSATPPDSVRLATYRPSKVSKRLLIIWLGDEVATAIGLRDRREMVEILSDNSGETLRVAIRRSADGEFFASKKLRAYSVHLDAAASALLVDDELIGRGIIGPDQLRIEGDMVAFDLPEGRTTGSQL